jgi:hypothetical protein
MVWMVILMEWMGIMVKYISALNAVRSALANTIHVFAAILIGDYV